MNSFDKWFSRKLDRVACTIRESRTVEEKYVKINGSKAEFAWLRLSAEPAASFDFRSLVRWPDQQDKHNLTIVDAIMDELLSTGVGQVVSKVRFTLTDIRWNETDSNRKAFYLAARAAVKKILALDEHPDNVKWEIGHRDR